MQTTKKRNGAILLIALCWLVYTCSYVGKVNYAANINQIMEFYSVNHNQAGLVSTLFFFSYGVGQILNGVLCKKYNIKWIIFASLTVSGIINLAVAVTSNFILIRYLWCINGFVLAILWPTLIRLLAETLSQKDMAKASVIMGTTVAAGTFFVYGISAVFVALDAFKLSFYTAAFVLLGVALVWIFTVSKTVRSAKTEEEHRTPQPSQQVSAATTSRPSGLLTIVCMLAFYGIITNLIKDGLTTWVPSILKENYALDDALSIVLTLALPIVSVFGNAFAVKLHQKVPDFVFHSALVFLVSGTIIGGVIAGLSLDRFILTLTGFAVVCLLVSSNNSLITSIFPLFMKGKLNSGLIAGILNGFCYVGSTVSSYGLGWVADHFGWSAVFWLLLLACAVACIAALFYGIFRHQRKE